MIIKILKEETPWSGVVACIYDFCMWEETVKSPWSNWVREWDSISHTKGTERKEEEEKFPRWVGEEKKSGAGFSFALSVGWALKQISLEKIPSLTLSKFRILSALWSCPSCALGKFLGPGTTQELVFSQWTTYIHTRTQFFCSSNRYCVTCSQSLNEHTI